MPPFNLNKLKVSNIIFCSAIFKKQDWELVRGYDDNLKQGWEDWEFFISLLKKGGEVKCLDTVGFYYRVKEKSMVTQMNEKVQNEVFSYINRKHLDFFGQKYPEFKSLRNENLPAKKATLCRRILKLLKL